MSAGTARACIGAGWIGWWRSTAAWSCPPRRWRDGSPRGCAAVADRRDLQAGSCGWSADPLVTLGGGLMWFGAVVPPLLALGMVAYLVAGWRADNRGERLRVARHEELMTAIRRVR